MSENWDDRAIYSYSYRNEVFYTITPVPYYLHRRNWLLSEIRRQIEDLSHPPVKVLDFGCGDGFYTRFISALLPNAEVCGYDPALEMVKRARESNGNDRILYTSELSEIAQSEQFDFVICIAVLAHIDDEQLADVVDKMASACVSGATLLWFEQTSDISRKGPGWHRRTVGQLTDTALPCGLGLKASKRYARPVFNGLVRPVYLVEAIHRRILKAMGYAVPSNPNRTRVFRMLFSLCEVLSRPFESELMAREGNSLFIFRSGRS